jgi:Fe2+ or Zn2+ uptake regulation protein
MTELADLLSKQLKDNGYSITKPRQITFDALLDTKQPLTMQELIRRTTNKIDRASVYRTIEVFEKTGVTQRIYNGWKYKLELSDAFQEHHHHFTCVNCGLITPLHSEQLEIMIGQLTNKLNYKIMTHQLEIQGYCDKCK